MIVPADSRYPRPSSLTSSIDIQHSDINDPELAWRRTTKAAAGSELGPTSPGPAAIQPVPVRARRGADPNTCTVVLVRRRRGCGEAGRVVHVVPLSDGTGTSGLLGALCGTLLAGEEVETVEPGVGVPCTGCLLYRDAMALPPSVSSYREWGWPVRSSADQVLLDLGGECTAVVLPPDRGLAGCREIEIFGAVHTTLHAAAAAKGQCGK